MPLLQSDLTTARILYRRPDRLWLLQMYVWQEYDLAPGFPKLRKFVTFWREKLTGPIHSITVTSAQGLRQEFQFADHYDTLH